MGGSRRIQRKSKLLELLFLNSLEDSGEFLGDKDEIEKVKEKLQKTIEQMMEMIQLGNFAELDRRTSHECKFRHLE